MAAFRAGQLQIVHDELFGAGGAPLAAGTPFDLKFEVFKRSVMGQRFEGEFERVLVNIGQFPDTYANGEDLRTRMTAGFRFHTFEN